MALTWSFPDPALRSVPPHDEALAAISALRRVRVPAANVACSSAGKVRPPRAPSRKVVKRLRLAAGGAAPIFVIGDRI